MPAQPADATDRHMEDFFKQVTDIKVCLDRVCGSGSPGAS